MMEENRSTAFLAALLYGAAAITDLFDGYLARRSGQVTVIGKFLDPLADKLMVVSILITLLHMKRIDLWIVALILAREFTITGLRAIASTEGMVIQARELGKQKTAFQMVGLAGLLLHFPYLVNFGFAESRIDFHRCGLIFLLISLFFSLASAVDYFIEFFREMRKARRAKR